MTGIDINLIKFSDKDAINILNDRSKLTVRFNIKSKK